MYICQLCLSQKWREAGISKIISYKVKNMKALSRMITIAGIAAAFAS
jgi:hypothetical protein